MDEGKFWLKLLTRISIIVSFLIIILAAMCHYKDIQFIKNGYERQAIVGFSYPQWIKTK